MFSRHLWICINIWPNDYTISFHSPPGSCSIDFSPGSIRSGKFVADIGTAGSVCLLLQIVLPCLLYAPSPSLLVLKGEGQNHTFNFGVFKNNSFLIPYQIFLIQRPLPCNFRLSLPTHVIVRRWYRCRLCTPYRLLQTCSEPSPSSLWSYLFPTKCQTWLQPKGAWYTTCY